MRAFVSIVAAVAVAVSAPVAAPSGRPSTETVVVNGSGAGFHWGDAGIGAAAGFGTAVVLWGVIALRRIR